MTASTTSDTAAASANVCRVLVIGGGLSGIAASVRLADHGYAVTLIETGKRLGGRATSFEDGASGQTVDNCQHVLMGCCTNLKDLYERLGALDLIEWHRKLYFSDAQGRIDVLQARALPAPLHMSTSMLRFKSLRFSEKFAIARAMLRIMRIGTKGRSQLHDRSFADWLADQRQPPGAIRKYWDNIVISALNEQPQNVAADYAIQVFQQGFLNNKQAYVMGVPRVPLVRLYDAARATIEQAGGKVMFGAGAQQFEYDADHKCVTGLQLTDGARLEADVFVSALPFDRLGRICSSAMQEADDRLVHLDEFKVSPILGIHLWFPISGENQRVMDLPHLVLSESPLQWIFDKGIENAPEQSDEPDAPSGKSQHLHGVISAAHDLVNKSADVIIEMAVAEVQKALSKTRGLEPVHARVIKEKRATFSARPGIEKIRPPATGVIGNLYLAGDFCRSGWPATMEGAVRSGYLAAAEVARSNDQPMAALVADLPVSLLYGLIARR